jgi:hypothetical protein
MRDSQSVCTKVSYLESQAVAGRWRTAAFDAISSEIGHLNIFQLRTQLAYRIFDESLMPLLKCVFGPDKRVEPTAKHVESLAGLVLRVWEWCVVLKGKVTLPGDFQPTIHQYGVTFDPQVMAEFEPNLKNQTCERILATIGLGLTVSCALGAGKAPERTVLCKASVVTDRWFEEI